MSKVFKKVVGAVMVVVGAATGQWGVAAAGASLLFSREPKIPRGNETTQTRTTKSLDPEAFRKIVFGRTAAPADLRYWEVYAGESYDEVYAVATHKITSFQELYLDDELVPFSGNNATGTYAGVLSRRTSLVGTTGTSLQVGSQVLWTANASMTGLAHMALKWTVDKEKLPNGIPQQVVIVVEGAPVYDPRKDLTRGGIGSHRVDDQSTWDYSAVDSNGQPIGRNPALQRLWYLLGWRITSPQTSEEILVAGRGVDPDDIDMASFIAAANACETEGYYSDCALSTGDSHAKNEEMIDSACMGTMLDTSGFYSYHIATDDTANIAVSLDEGDIVGPVEFSPKFSMSDQFNQISGTYIDPASMYKRRSFPLVTDDTYTAADGYKKRQTFAYDAVQDPDQAQKLAYIELNKMRFQGVFRAPFSRKAFRAQNWDIVTLTFAGFGWSNKLFRVINYEIVAADAIILTLAEENASIYTPGTVATVDPPRVPATHNPYGKISVGNLTVSTVTITGAGGTVRDGLTVAWDVPIGTVARTELQLRKYNEGSWTPIASNIRRVENLFTIPDVQPQTQYEVRVRHWNVDGVPGDWFTTSAVSGDNTEDTATRVIYTGGGTVDSLRPAEAGSTAGATIGANLKGPGNAVISGANLFAPIPRGINSGAMGDLLFEANKDQAGSANDGEIRVTNQADDAELPYFNHPTLGKTTLAKVAINTPWEGANNPIHGRAFVVWSDTDLTIRFGGTFDGSHSRLFTATYDPETDAWTAWGNTTSHVMSVDAEDVVLALLVKDTTGGIDGLNSLVGNEAPIATRVVTVEGRQGVPGDAANDGGTVYARVQSLYEASTYSSGETGARLQFIADANGAVASGWLVSQTNPQGVSSSAVGFLADTFQIWNPNTSGFQETFTVSGSKIAMNTDVEISGSLLVAGSVASASIAADTLTGREFNAEMNVTVGSDANSRVSLSGDPNIAGRIWAGAVNWSDAPFSVTSAGAVRMSSFQVIDTAGNLLLDSSGFSNYSRNLLLQGTGYRVSLLTEALADDTDYFKLSLEAEMTGIKLSGRFPLKLKSRPATLPSTITITLQSSVTDPAGSPTWVQEATRSYARTTSAVNAQGTPYQFREESTTLDIEFGGGTFATVTEVTTDPLDPVTTDNDLYLQVTLGTLTAGDRWFRVLVDTDTWVPDEIGRTINLESPSGSAGFALTDDGVTAGPSGASNSFTGLYDTPVSYAGSARRVPMVGDTELSLELRDLSHISRTVNVWDYGVLPANSASANVTALNALIAEATLATSDLYVAPNGKVLLYFPPGTYALDAVIDFAGAAFVVKGAGQNLTQFVWQGSNPTGFKTQPSNVLGNHMSAEFYDFTMYWTGYNANTIGIDVHWPDDQSGVTFGNQINYTARARAYIKNVIMYGSGTGNYPPVGIRMRNVSSFSIKNFLYEGSNSNPVYGSPAYFDGTGIIIETQTTADIVTNGQSIEPELQMCSISDCDTGILIQGYPEGIYIHHSNVVRARYGLRAVAAAGSTQPSLVLHHNHFNCVYRDVLIDGYSQSYLQGNSFSYWNQAGELERAIQMTGAGSGPPTIGETVNAPGGWYATVEDWDAVNYIMYVGDEANTLFDDEVITGATSTNTWTESSNSRYADANFNDEEFIAVEIIRGVLGEENSILGNHFLCETPGLPTNKIVTLLYADGRYNNIDNNVFISQPSLPTGTHVHGIHVGPNASETQIGSGNNFPKFGQSRNRDIVVADWLPMTSVTGTFTIGEAITYSGGGTAVVARYKDGNLWIMDPTRNPAPGEVATTASGFGLIGTRGATYAENYRSRLEIKPKDMYSGIGGEINIHADDRHGYTDDWLVGVLGNELRVMDINGVNRLLWSKSGSLRLSDASAIRMQLNEAGHTDFNSPAGDMQLRVHSDGINVQLGTGVSFNANAGNLYNVGFVSMDQNGGSATYPSIRRANTGGGEQTGLYWPAVDKVGLTAGGTAGLEVGGGFVKVLNQPLQLGKYSTVGGRLEWISEADATWAAYVDATTWHLATPSGLAITVTQDNNVALYNNENIKFTTDANGVRVYGRINIDGTSTQLYNEDLQLGADVFVSRIGTAQGALWSGGTQRVIWDGSGGTLTGAWNVTSSLTVGGSSVALDSDLSAYLPLAGGVMSGALDLNGNDLIVAADGSAYIHEGATGRIDIFAGGGNRVRIGSATVDVVNVPLFLGRQNSLGGEIQFQASTGNSKTAYIRQTTVDGQLAILSYDGVSDYDTLATFNDGGSVQLFHNDSVRFETNSSGITVTSQIALNPGSVVFAVSGSDGVLKHGAFSQIAWSSTNVSLRYQGTEKLFTSSAGGTLVGTWDIGGSPLATQGWVGSQGYLTSIPDNYVLNTGDTMTGTLTLGNGYLNSGTGTDLFIQRDGSNRLRFTATTINFLNAAPFIASNAGSQIQFQPPDNVSTVYMGAPSSGLASIQGYDSVALTNKTMATFDIDGGVFLNYNDAQRFETTSAGGTLTGTWNATTNLQIGGASVATQTWVNSQGFATGGPFLPLAGGTLTGTLTVTGSLTIDHAGSDVFATIIGPSNRDLRIDLLGNSAADSLIVRSDYTGSFVEVFTVNGDGDGVFAGDLTANGGRVLADEGVYTSAIILDTKADFILKDSDDPTTNWFWRDRSADLLYMGTPDAVVTLRSQLDLNGNRILGMKEGSWHESAAGVGRFYFGPGGATYIATGSATGPVVLRNLDTDNDGFVFRPDIGRMVFNSGDDADTWIERSAANTVNIRAGGNDNFQVDVNRVFLGYQDSTIAQTSADALQLLATSALGGKLFFHGFGAQQDWQIVAQGTGVDQLAIQGQFPHAVFDEDGTTYLYGGNVAQLILNGAGGTGYNVWNFDDDVFVSGELHTSSGVLGVNGTAPALILWETDAPTNADYSRLVHSGGDLFIQSEGDIRITGYNAVDITSLTVRYAGAYHNIHHDGLFDIADYLPLAGGTMSGDLEVDGDIGADRIRLSVTTDASLASTDHAFQIGATGGANLIIDGNEIMARNNGGTSILYLQNEGGDVRINNETAWHAGNLDPSDYLPLAGGVMSGILDMNGQRIDMDADNDSWIISQGDDIISVVTGNAYRLQVSNSSVAVVNAPLFLGSVGGGGSEIQMAAPSGAKQVRFQHASPGQLAVVTFDGVSDFDTLATFDDGLGVTLFYNDAPRLATSSAGGDLTGNWTLTTNASSLYFRDSAGAASSRIVNTNSLYIQSALGIFNQITATGTNGFRWYDSAGAIVFRIEEDGNDWYHYNRDAASQGKSRFYDSDDRTGARTLWQNYYYARNSADSYIAFGQALVYIADETAGSEDSYWRFFAYGGGASLEALRAHPTNGITTYTATGNVTMGSQNASFAHFYTDRPRYYFDEGINAEDGFKIHGTNNDWTASQLQVDGEIRGDKYSFSNDTDSYFDHDGTGIRVIDDNNLVMRWSAGSIDIFNGNPLNFDAAATHDIQVAGEDRIMLLTTGVNIVANDSSQTIVAQFRQSGVSIVNTGFTLGKYGSEGGQLTWQGYDGGSTDWVADGSSIDQWRLWQTQGSKMHIVINEDGGPTLYYDGTARFNTADHGVTSNGAVVVSEVGTYDAGTDTSAVAAFVMPSGGYFFGESTNGYLRTLIGWTQSGNLDIGQTGTSLIGTVRILAGSAGHVELFGAGGKLFETVSGGAKVTGNLETTGLLTASNITNNGTYTSNSTSTRDKIRVWNSGTYAIGMQSAFTYGDLNDYAMTFQMNNETDRGFWWGHSGHTQAQGAMSLTTDGRLVVNSSIRVGDAAGSVSEYGALITAKSNTNAIEWGHTNTAGYDAVLGSESASGNPFIGFSVGHGTASSSYRTTEFKGSIIRGDRAGGIDFLSADLTNTDSQTPTKRFAISGQGVASFTSNVWHNSIDGVSRLFFGTNTATYIGSYANTPTYITDNGGEYIAFWPHLNRIIPKNSDSDTYFHHAADNTLGMVTGGVTSAFFSASGIIAKSLATTGGSITLEGESTNLDWNITQDAAQLSVGSSSYTHMIMTEAGGTNLYHAGVQVVATNGSGWNVLKGMKVGSPTGGWKGDGTINAVAVYDDNTLLSCYVFQQAVHGYINMDYWDSMVPDREYETRRHDPARMFHNRIGTEYDPLDLDGYAKHWAEKGHLTSMPNEEKFDAKLGMSTGEWTQRLIETVEIQAVLIEKLNQKDKEQQAQITAMENRLAAIEELLQNAG